MHEVSIAQSIVSMVESMLPANENSSVNSVQVKVGELSAIETDALLFAFDIVKAKTPLQKAILEIEKIEGRGKCSDCGEEFSMSHYATPCPACNSYLIHVSQGKEMKVVSFELE